MGRCPFLLKGTPQMTATKRRKKAKKGSSKAANLQRRISMIANGMDQAGPNSPVFLLINGRIRKLKRVELHGVASAENGCDEDLE
jgi:hypothetical protein